ncbi:MAG: EF-P lysine aminoacylase GenX [Gammaproteobacteria bacterium]|nr:EF-P lysine aminoacylase GenX [Gammaproteobacteria bacterium]
MLDWRPAAGPELLARRAEFLASTREFFAARSVLEVQTPILVSSSCPDPNIPSITAMAENAGRMFLHTSPEHAMKRLLAAGSGDIYQVAQVFRDGEAGHRHNPEFTMVEWYRLGYDHIRMAAETVEYINFLLPEPLPDQRLSYRQAFQDSVGLDPHRVSVEELQTVCFHFDIDVPDSMSSDVDSWLDLVLSTRIAPGFEAGRLIVLYDYPASQAALARLSDTEPPVAQRFEVFCGPVELANGFYELADEAEQKLRFEAEQKQSKAVGKTPPPLDLNLLAALKHGLPDCAGVALGFDRLLMLATGSAKLADVIAFPFDRA